MDSGEQVNGLHRSETGADAGGRAPEEETQEGAYLLQRFLFSSWQEAHVWISYLEKRYPEGPGEEAKATLQIRAPGGGWLLPEEAKVVGHISERGGVHHREGPEPEGAGEAHHGENGGHEGR